MARFGFLATTLAIKFLLPIWPSRSNFGRLQFPFWGCERLHGITLLTTCLEGSGCFQRNLLWQFWFRLSTHSLDRANVGSTPLSALSGPVTWLRQRSLLPGKFLRGSSGTPKGIFLILLLKALCCMACLLCWTSLHAIP